MKFYLNPFIILAIFLIPSVSSTQIRIELPDTLIERGNTNKIKLPVYGSITVTPLNKIKILFVYKSSVIILDKAFGYDSVAMKSTFPKVNLDNTKIDSTIIEVSDTNVQPVNNGIICFLDLEGLAGSDSVTYIDVKSVEINDSKYPDIIKKPAVVKVSGAPVFEVLPESIGIIKPNPFSAITELDFYIKVTTRVRFFIYSISGNLIQDSWKPLDKVNIAFYNKYGENLNVDENFKFIPGEYRIIIEPVIWEVSAGLYLILMQTDNGLYNNNFIYWK